MRPHRSNTVSLTVFMSGPEARGEVMEVPGLVLLLVRGAEII